MIDRVTLPQVGVVILATITVLVFIFSASTSTTAFGVYNAAWDGAADLRSQANAVGTTSEIGLGTASYSRVPPERTVAIILAPDTGYNRSEVDDLRSFVRRGGTLVVADDFGSHTNMVLRGIGAEARIDGAPLRDERYNYHHPALPVARNVSDHPLVAEVDRLTLNYATAVRPGNATVLVSTSEYAYRDTNQNGELGTDESLGSYPVATVERIGRGRLLVLGDPSAMINTMLDRPGNEAFVRNIFAAHDHALLDYSNAKSLPPLAMLVLILRRSPLLQFLLGVGGIGAILSLGWRKGVLNRLHEVLKPEKTSEIRVDPTDLPTVLQQRYPDWDEGRVRKVTKRIRTHRENGENDE